MLEQFRSATLGKTALVHALCKAMRKKYNIAVVTNNVYTQKKAQFLMRFQALSSDRQEDAQFLVRSQPFNKRSHFGC